MLPGVAWVSHAPESSVGVATFQSDVGVVVGMFVCSLSLLFSLWLSAVSFDAAPSLLPSLLPFSSLLPLFIGIGENKQLLLVVVLLELSCLNGRGHDPLPPLFL